MNRISEFHCKKQNCVSSCCGAFNGVSNKIISIDMREFKDIVLTTRDLDRIRGSKYDDFIYVAEDGIGRVKIAEDGACQAYKLGQCLINEVKPTICKCFPLYLDVFTGLCAIKDCPSVDQSLTIKNFSNELEHFLEMCEFWVAHYREKLDKFYRNK